MTDPQKITDADVAAILADNSDPPVVEDASFVELVEGAGRWLQEKMENDPESLPPTFMVKLYLDGKKAIAAKAVEPELNSDNQVSILDRIDAVPAEHAITILKGEIARLDSLRAEYFAALERLGDA